MNGLTNSEKVKLAAIREAASKFYMSHDPADLHAAKRMASEWVIANKRRRSVREGATRTVKHLHAHI